ncbi:hypothetical protein [Amycolatopsis sp. cmx-4-54]|uniref:hypothetical protein n=1 Tax=Amycolatopsis sp. cmx-4-54 TaxID=2790936 RepID=UPI00397A9959
MLVGAIATYTATSAAERVRWRRAQAVRWDEKRLKAYSDYADAIKKVISIAVRLAAFHGIHPDRDTLAPTEGLPMLAVAEEERTLKFEPVLLLGGSQVVKAARAWHHSTFRLQRIASGKSTDFSWAEAVRAVSHTRREFYEAARRDLGIPDVEGTESFEWQLAKLLPLPGDDSSDERLRG